MTIVEVYKCPFELQFSLHTYLKPFWQGFREHPYRQFREISENTQTKLRAYSGQSPQDLGPSGNFQSFWESKNDSTCSLKKYFKKKQSVFSLPLLKHSPPHRTWQKTKVFQYFLHSCLLESIIRAFYCANQYLNFMKVRQGICEI